MDIIFITKNEDKFKETKRLFDYNMTQKNCKNKFNLIQTNISIEEHQTSDSYKLLKDKLTSAFKIHKRPVMIEHTALEIDALGGCPGLQTSEFWNTITKEEEGKEKGEKLCELLNSLCSNKGYSKEIIKKAKVVTYYAYTDGKNTILADENKEILCKGVAEGFISDEPRGNSEFQWDMIFVPKGKNETYAELAAMKVEDRDNSLTEKDKISMRARAMDIFAEKLLDIKDFGSNKVGIDSNHIKEIAEKIQKEKLVLFIGSGVSSVIKLPSWAELIEKLGEELGYDKEMFCNLGDNLELAEYYILKKRDKKNIANYLSNMENIDKYISESDIHKSIANIGIKTIYTTNYEDLIERAFNIHKPEVKYRSIYDLETLNKVKSGEVEIVKLHGDLRKAEDIILSQTSYYERFDFENCLDIKLRNDLLTKSVLFIGYSFNDTNIKYMMKKLNDIWKGIEKEKRPKSYIFLTSNNPVQREIIEENNNMITIVSNEVEKSKALLEFLELVKAEIDAKK